MSKFHDYNYPNGTGRDTWRTGRGLTESSNIVDHGFTHRESLRDNSRGPFTGYQGFTPRNEDDICTVSSRIRVQTSHQAMRTTQTRLPQIQPHSAGTYPRPVAYPNSPQLLAMDSVDPLYQRTEALQRSSTAPASDGRCASPLSPLKYSRIPLRPIRTPYDPSREAPMPHDYRHQVMAPYIAHHTGGNGRADDAN